MTTTEPVLDIPDKPTRPHLSVSQIEMYERCSMQYWFRYINGQIQPPSIALATGKAGHTALERNNRTKIKTAQDLPLEAVLDTFSDAFDAETYGIDPEPGDDFGRNKDDAVSSLTLYRGKVAPLVQPAAVELPFGLEIPPDEYYQEPLRIIEGRIDLMEVVNGGLAVTDNKFVMSARGKKDQAEVDLSTQLSTYELALHDQGVDISAVGLTVFVPPGKTTPPTIQRLFRDPARMTPAMKEATRARTIHKFRTTEKAIKAGIFKPADNPKTCSWCGYRRTCQFSLAKNDYDAIQLRQKET